MKLIENVIFKCFPWTNYSVEIMNNTVHEILILRISIFYVKSRIFVEMVDDQIQSLLNKVSPFYDMAQFTDQQYRKIEICFQLNLVSV